MQTIISGNLKRLRKVKELTQWELAKLAGVSQATVSRIEDGGRVPRVAIIQKLAKALGQTPESLVKGAIERMNEEKVKAMEDALIEAQRITNEALDGWDSSNKDMIFFSAVFFTLGLLLGVSTLMLIVGLLS